MPERKTLNEDLFYRGSSANLPRLHMCENKVPFWDFSQFAVTMSWLSLFFPSFLFSFCSFFLLYSSFLPFHFPFLLSINIFFIFFQFLLSCFSVPLSFYLHNTFIFIFLHISRMHVFFLLTFLFFLSLQVFLFLFLFSFFFKSLANARPIFYTLVFFSAESFYMLYFFYSISFKIFSSLIDKPYLCYQFWNHIPRKKNTRHPTFFCLISFLLYISE